MGSADRKGAARRATTWTMGSGFVGEGTSRRYASFSQSFFPLVVLSVWKIFGRNFLSFCFLIPGLFFSRADKSKKMRKISARLGKQIG